MSLFTIGEGLVVCIAVRSLIPTEYYEVAAIEGVGALGVFRRITLPMLAPILLLLAMRDAAFAFQATFVPALVVTDGGPPPFSTTYLPLYAYRNSFEYLRYGYGAAITLVMLVVTALVLVAAAGGAQAASDVSLRSLTVRGERVLRFRRGRPAAGCRAWREETS